MTGVPAERGADGRPRDHRGGQHLLAGLQDQQTPQSPGPDRGLIVRNIFPKIISEFSVNCCHCAAAVQQQRVPPRRGRGARAGRGERHDRDTAVQVGQWQTAKSRNKRAECLPVRYAYDNAM